MKFYHAVLLTSLWIGCSLHSARADDLYALEVTAVNPPPRAWDKIQARSLYLLSILVNADSSLSALGPGESIPYADDDDNYDDSDPPSNATEAGLPGARGLQGGSQCPPGCWNSNAQYCRNLGCAYCGSSCRNNRQLQDEGPTTAHNGGILSEMDILAIEARIDNDLKRFCRLRANCAITSNVVWVNSDGSTSLVTDGDGSDVTNGDDAGADDAAAASPP